MSHTIPIFRIFDYAKAIEFYIHWLGFTVDWEHAFEADTPKYMQISLRGIRLHLSEHHGDCSPGARAIISDFDGLQAYHSVILAKQYRHNRPGIGPSFWDENITEMEVIDPFRNILTFWENVRFAEGK